MTYAFCIVMALLPSWVLFRYFVNNDKFPEPPETLRMVFKHGVYVAFWVLLCMTPLSYLFLDEWIASSELVFASALMAFGSAAIPEEFFKHQVLRRHVAPHKDFDEPMDGVVYGAVASLGFATIENLLYCASGGLETALMRAFTAVPAHAAFGAIMGYTFARRHFAGKSNGLFGPAMWLPVLLHGVYNWMLFMISGVATEVGEVEPSEDQAALLGLCVLVFLSVGLFMFWKVRRNVKIMRLEQEAM